jgi:formylglycine-generating enzyme required for sulfatase activity
MASPVPLHRALYPRQWKSPEGQARKRRLVGTAVPWDECPVVGISFFEAVAYAVWLSSLTGEELSLPNEAQYERASSWPAEGMPPDGKPVKLMPQKKLIFPWQDHCPNDFNYFFGREGFEIEGYYRKNRKSYEELMENTARRLDGQAIYQLEGFGWHWTCDRYSDTELKYSRFSDPDYPHFTDVPCLVAPGKRAEVYHYVPNRNPGDSFVVLKGSPDVVGGPGLTTRRYAAYPLRGYGNVGFRLVRRES